MLAAAAAVIVIVDSYCDGGAGGSRAGGGRGGGGGGGGSGDEVAAAELVAEHPPTLELVGADVCVMSAVYPEDAQSLTRSGAVGWRATVTQTRGGAPNVQVRVFGSWFALGDETFLKPIRQPEHRALQAVARAGLSAALTAAHAAARAARARGARDAAAAWATAWVAQLTRRAARGRTAAQLGLCVAELAAGTTQHSGLASGTALQVLGGEDDDMKPRWNDSLVLCVWEDGAFRVQVGGDVDWLEDFDVEDLGREWRLPPPPPVAQHKRQQPSRQGSSGSSGGGGGDRDRDRDRDRERGDRERRSRDATSRDAPLPEEGRGVCGGKRRRAAVNYAEEPKPEEPEELTREQRQQQRQQRRSGSGA